MKRKLKIEEHGNEFGKESGSLIRIKGKWLRRLGFPPGASVELTAISPGVMEIRLCSPPRLMGEDFHRLCDRLTAATEAASGKESRP